MAILPNFFNNTQSSDYKQLSIPLLLDKIDRHYRDNQSEQVMEIYQQLVKIVPQHANYTHIFTNLACFYQDSKDFIKAEEYFQLSLKLQKNIRDRKSVV